MSKIKMGPYTSVQMSIQCTVFNINVPNLPGGTVMLNLTLCIFSDKCPRRYELCPFCEGLFLEGLFSESKFSILTWQPNPL